MKKQITKAVILILMLIILNSNAYTEWAVPRPIPADRLIINITARIIENPKDANNYYNLARVYYLVFYNESAMVPGDDNSNAPAPYWMMEKVPAKNEEFGKITKAQAMEYVKSAQHNFLAAIKLDS